MTSGIINIPVHATTRKVPAILLGKAAELFCTWIRTIVSNGAGILANTLGRNGIDGKHMGTPLHGSYESPAQVSCEALVGTANEVLSVAISLLVRR